MVEAPFEVEVKRPFGEEIVPEPEKGRAGGEHPKAGGSSKRPAGGEPEGPTEKKKARQDTRRGKGKHIPCSNMHYRKYGCDSAPDLINLLFKSAAAAATGLTAGKKLRAE